MRFRFATLVRQCNVHDRQLYLPLTLASPSSSQSVVKLEPFQEVFDWSRIENEVRFLPCLDTEAKRTAAIQGVAKSLKPETWRDEAYGAYRNGFNEPWFRLDRSASTFFGISQFGCHLNGYVRHSSNKRDLSVWLAVRDVSKVIHPGRLDSLVGGGKPWDISPFENMLKEAEEEAGLDTTKYEGSILPTGVLTYVNDEVHGFKYNTMYVFDLELPLSWKPHNLDGEVAGFELHSVDSILMRMKTTPEDFKGDICLLLLDFFIRHGILTPADLGDEYTSICTELHTPPPF